MTKGSALGFLEAAQLLYKLEDAVANLEKIEKKISLLPRPKRNYFAHFVRSCGRDVSASTALKGQLSFSKARGSIAAIYVARLIPL